jgi:DNA-directed RNA polymerase subunit H
MNRQEYNITEYSNFSINEINSLRQNNQLDMLLEKNVEDIDTNRKSKIYIRYYLTKTIRLPNVDEIIDDLYNLEETLIKNDTLLIIVKDEPSEPIINKLKHIFEKDNIFIIIINIKRLQFNILDHEMVPMHRVMKKDEVDIIKKQYNIIDNFQFPDISRFDPVAQVIGIKPGQVCEITRSSKTAITTKYYRICI